MNRSSQCRHHEGLQCSCTELDFWSELKQTHGGRSAQRGGEWWISVWVHVIVGVDWSSSWKRLTWFSRRLRRFCSSLLVCAEPTSLRICNIFHFSRWQTAEWAPSLVMLMCYCIKVLFPLQLVAPYFCWKKCFGKSSNKTLSPIHKWEVVNAYCVLTTVIHRLVRQGNLQERHERIFTHAWCMLKRKKWNARFDALSGRILRKMKVGGMKHPLCHKM